MGPTSQREVHLRRCGAAVGDIVEVDSGRGTYRGVLMPHHGFSGDDIVTLKLDSGYNVGVRLDDGSRVQLIERAAPRSPMTRKILGAKGLPRVSILGTGGTIASYVDYRTGAVHPATTAEELAFAVPEMFEHADVTARVVFQVFSEDFTPKNWSTLAEEVKREFDAGSIGVVIPHGTDTLGYTAAALSFMVSDLPGPVVLVGSQRSSDRPSSDAAVNLLSAVRVAAEADLGEVVVVMHASMADDAAIILRGNRARKMHTSRRDTFRSVDAAPLGEVTIDGPVVDPGATRRSKGPVKVASRVDDRVKLIYSHPGLKAADFETVERGVVIAGTGLGHIPQALIHQVERLVASGKVVVMASQCLGGRVNMNVYSTGRDLLKAGAVSALDMTPETALVKLMWALGQAKDTAGAIGLFTEDVARESDPRSRVDADGVE